jgi:DNA-binding IclR family transcriptional regulator
MLARPVLADLARTTRAEASLGVLKDGEVAYLAHSGHTRTDVTPLAPALPAHATAIGKALLAFSPTSVVDRVLAEGLRPADAAPSPDKIRQALSLIRLTQIATAHDEYRPGRSAIAVPVFSGGGKVVAAIELTVREAGTDLKAAGGALTVACRSLSRQLATELRDRESGGCNGNGSTHSA